MKKCYELITLVCLLTYSMISVADNSIKLDIRGVNEELKKNIESSLDVSTLQNQSNSDIEQFFLDSPAEVKKAIEPFGYFESKVTYTLTHQGNNWLATFDIDPGPPIRINSIDFKLTGEGVNDPAFQKLVSEFALAKQQIFSSTAYQEEKNKFTNLAAERGYYRATFEAAKITIDLKRYRADIILHFNTGPRYRFGDILFNKTVFDNRFLKRFAPFKTDEFYNAAKIREFQQSLSSSDYFSTAQVEPDFTEAENNTVPIHVQLKPVTPRQYTAGVGFGTDTGPRGLLGFTWKPTTAVNTLKSPHKLLRLILRSGSDYIIPGKNPATDQYVLSAAVLGQDIGTGTSYIQKLSASYIHDVGSWKQTLALTLQRERSTLADNSASTTQIMLIPSINWLKVTQDNLLRPTRGYRINFGILGTPDIGGNTAFVQTKLNLKAIYPLWQQDRVIMRGSIGRTFTQNFNNLPLSFQFFGGGAQSIRGYSYESLGPGSNLLIGSVEYRRHITGDWYAAAFIDAGSVDNNIGENFKKGIGAGVVWQSPLGALELTLAQAQDAPGKPLALQFSMGPIYDKSVVAFMFVPAHARRVNRVRRGIYIHHPKRQQICRT